MRTSRRTFIARLGALALPSVARGLAGREYFEACHSAFDKAWIRVPVDSTTLDDSRYYCELLRSSRSANAKELAERSKLLYRKLWRPLEQCGRSTPDVYIRSTGPLGIFPFESLRIDPPDRDAVFVGQRYRIRFVRNTIATQPPLILPGERSFSYAPIDNRLPLSQIPWASRETGLIEGIKGLQRLGRQASRKKLFDDTRTPFSLIHIATHGTVNQENEICLALRKPEGDDGVDWLSSEEVKSHPMNGKLVVLSACESAVRSGSERLGIANSFLDAGVGEVLATRWNVDDLATLTFMRSLYQRLISQGHVGNGLRYARATMITSPFSVYQSPHFWAAFVLLA